MCVPFNDVKCSRMIYYFIDYASLRRALARTKRALKPPSECKRTSVLVPVTSRISEQYLWQNAKNSVTIPLSDSEVPFDNDLNDTVTKTPERDTRTSESIPFSEIKETSELQHTSVTTETDDTAGTVNLSENIPDSSNTKNSVVDVFTGKPFRNSNTKMKQVHAVCVASKEKKHSKKFEKSLESTSCFQQVPVKSKLGRKHYCVYCNKLVVKLSRHLEQIHSSEEAVLEMLQCPKGKCKFSWCILYHFPVLWFKNSMIHSFRQVQNLF